MAKFAFIIGAMKCGTSSLFAYLSQHPDVLGCSIKEPQFFTNELEKGYDWYLQLWDKDLRQDKILLEASTNYTKMPVFPNAAERIAGFVRETNADAKFIYIMRNPVDRIESQYTHALSSGWSSHTIEQVVDCDSEYIELSRYAKQLDVYYEMFPADDILLLNFQDLIEEPAAVIHKICSFLDIDGSCDFEKPGRAYNRNKDRRSNRGLNALLDNVPLLRSLGEIFPKRLRTSIANVLSKKVAPVSLSDDQRNQVLDHLKEDLTRLESKYKVDISRWGIEV